MTPAGLWHRWTLDPLVILALGGAAVAYGWGIRRLWRVRAGRGVPAWRAVAFGAGLLTVGAALVSPIHAAGGVLLWAHMLQHLLLVSVAAPLLVLGAPAVPLGITVPPAWRRWGRRVARRGVPAGAWRAFRHPLTGWLAAFAALVLWHVPVLYDLAARDGALHAAEHASFLGTSIMFWWAVFPPAGHRRLARGADMLYVVSASLYGSALGALFTFAGSPLYPLYASHAAALRSFGLTPLQDQQLAGLIMWIPFGAIYLVVAAVLFVQWLEAVERETRRAEDALGFPPLGTVLELSEGPS
jgi:putative membrane protein